MFLAHEYACRCGPDGGGEDIHEAGTTPGTKFKVDPQMVCLLPNDAREGAQRISIGEQVRT